MSGPPEAAAAPVRPFWLERQLDLDGPDAVVVDPDRSGGDAAQVNVTHRSWTVQGTLASPERAAVDPRGLVWVADGRWGLDWWIGAGDRWRFPSREPAVRQQLDDAGPVVETIVRVGGGDVVHRVGAVEAAGGPTPGGTPVLVVEIENRTPVPVVIALALHPDGPDRVGAIARIDLDDRVVRVDGEVALHLDRAPTGAVVADGDADLAALVVAEAARPGPATVTSDDGRARAALVFPLVHRTILRVVVPLRPSALEPPPPPPSHTTPGTAAAEPARELAVPELERVTRGWAVQADRGTRVGLPPGRLADLVAAARRHLLASVAGPDLGRFPHTDAESLADTAVVLDALDLWGFAEEVEGVLGSWEERQADDGSIVDGQGRVDATGAALLALGRHWELAPDPHLAEAAVPLVAKAVHAVERRHRGRRRDAREHRGVLLPAGPAPRWVGPAPGAAPSLPDAAWTIAGLRAVDPLLVGAGEHDAAAVAAALARDLQAQLLAQATPVLPAHVGQGAGPGTVGVLAAVAPLGVLDAADPAAAATLDWIRAHATHRSAVVEARGPAGLSPLLTAWLAEAELALGDERALARLSWLTGAASPTAAWPEVVHPRTGDGSVGAGHHAAAGAAFLRLVRHLLVRPVSDGLALCSLLPDGWEGQSLEIHDAPTPWGVCGFALRWHGERPALLWELEPAAGVDGDAVVWRAPGLDPSWRATGARGEALLAPYVPRHPVPGADAALPEPSPESVPESSPSPGPRDGAANGGVPAGVPGAPPGDPAGSAAPASTPAPTPVPEPKRRGSITIDEGGSFA